MQPTGPVRTPDPVEARRTVQRHGAVVITCAAVDESFAVDRAVAKALTVFEDHPIHHELGQAVGGSRGRGLDVPDGPDGLDGLAVTAGVEHGDGSPDYVVLIAAGADRDASTGGTTTDGVPAVFVVDGYAVLDSLRTREGGGALVQRLLDVPVEQSGPVGQDRSCVVAPVVGATRHGRTLLRRFPSQRPRTDAADPEADTAMIEAWADAVGTAAADAPRFTLAPGEAVVIDNYRMLHGVDPHRGAGALRTVCVWTTIRRPDVAPTRPRGSTGVRGVVRWRRG